MGTANYAFLVLLYQVLGQQCIIAFPCHSSTGILFMMNSLNEQVFRQDQAMAPIPTTEGAHELRSKEMLFAWHELLCVMDCRHTGTMSLFWAGRTCATGQRPVACATSPFMVRVLSQVATSHTCRKRCRNA